MPSPRTSSSRSNSHRPVLLYLAHRVPYPPDKGDRIRTYQFLRYLTQHCDVDLACLADEPVEPGALVHLRQICRRVAIIDHQSKLRWLRAATSLALGGAASVGAFRSRQLRTTLRQWGAETRYDAALASASSVAPYLRLPELSDTAAIVDLIDVDSQKWFDYAASRRGPKSWLYALEGRRLRRLERELAGWAKALVLVSDAEVAILRRFCKHGRVEAIGNGVDLEYFEPTAQVAGPSCVFLGALDYWPNVEGLTWFCREVWPHVRRRQPEATLSLVGRRPAPAVCRLAKSAGVRLIGQVPDVRPHVSGAAVSVVPLRIARGIQNKVLESLAMGKATVVSPQALEGLSARPGEHLLSASDAEQWTGSLLQLFESATLRRRLGDAGRRHVEDCHAWNRCLEPLGALVHTEQPGWTATPAGDHDLATAPA